MAWLLIDNSNTRTKLRLGDEHGLMEWRAVIPTCEMEEGVLDRVLAEVEVCGVVVASVVPEKENLLMRYFQRKANYHRLTAASPLGYEMEVPFPEQIGHDRLANMVALKAKYGVPSIAIDFGTAVTFSVLSEQGTFMGGVIAPGMSCMTEYLAEKTAQLPKVEAADVSSAVGKTTEEALRIGAVLGQRGMLREILSGLVAEVGGSPTVVATGGGAKFAARDFSAIHHVDGDLTLEGLRILATRVF